MKFRSFFMAVMAGAALFVGCNKEVDFGPAKVALDQTNLAFEVAGGSQAVSLTATRDWAVNGVPEWVAVSATNGQAAVEAQPLKITVTQNAAYDRSATLVFTIGFARTSLVINQAGPNGQVDNGDGTLENPYNVTGVIEYLNELGADVNSPKKVFVKGKVSALASKESDQFGGTGNTFGNGSFTMSDDGSVNGGQFTAYRINYLGNKKFAAGDTPVVVGDEVIVYGNVVNYKGNTPETQQNQAFLYSLNGENRGGVDAGSGEDGEEVPDENLEPASDNNIAGLVAKIDKAATQSAPTAIADFALTGATVTYVNGSSAYIEDKSGAVLLYKSGHGLKAGDVLSGTLSTSGYYRYGVPQLTSLDGITPTAGEAPVPTEMTIEYLLSTYSSQLSRFLIIKDITVSTGMSGRNAVISQGDKSVNVYAGLSSGLNLAQDATGDIIVFPTLYNTTKQVSFWDNSHFTGNGGGSEPGPVEPGTNDGLTPASAFTASEAAAWVMANLEDKAVTETKYYVKGTIQRFYQSNNVDQNFTNNSYKQASFFITDDGKENTAGEFEAYQINYLNGATFDPAKDTDVKVGDVVVIYGTLKRWGTTAETDGKGAAYLYSLNAEGGDTPGGDTELGVMDSNVTFGTGTNGYIDNKINVTYNGTKYSEVANVKMGKSSAYGDGTITIPAGTIQLNFFATGWKGADASVKFTIDGKEYTVDVKANDGATGTGTLELTVSDDDKYSITLPAALAAETKAKVETYSGSKTGYRAFVFAVHALAGEGGDEPGDEPGTDEPKLPVNDGLTEATAFTVQDAIYMAKNGTEDKEYFVKAVVGKDVSIKNGAASFELVDGTTDGKLTVVKAKSFGGEDFANDAPIEWLDEVILKGKVTEYSTLPALVNAQMVKWNGYVSFSGDEPAGGGESCGDGTLENPYNVTGVIEYLNELGADVYSPKKVFVKGKVSALASKEYDQFGGTGNTFGNGSFTMSDDGSVNGGQFTAYRINYLGNKKFAAGDTPVVVGDEVIVYGNVVNYKGNTPETQQNQAFLYSLNGENRGGVDAGSGEDGEEVPDENLEPAGENNIAGLVAKIDKAATQSAPTAIADFALTGATVTYVNGSSAYIEDKSGAVLLYKSGHGLKAGDVLSGTLSTSGYYRYGVPQLTSLDGITPTAGEAPVPTEMTIEYLLSTYSSQLSRFLIIKDITVSTGMSGRYAVISQGEKSINVYAGLSSGLNLAQDATGDIIVFPTLYNTTKQVSFWDNSHFIGNGSEPGGDEPGDEPSVDEKGTGTLEDPYNAAKANAVASALGKNAKSDEVYVKGKISSIKSVFGTQYGTAIFNISDDGTTTGSQFTCYGVYYLGNRAWEEGDAQVAVGDEVIIHGKLMNYNGTPETSNKEAYVYSINGKTSIEQTPVFGVAKTEISVAATATTATINVTGNVVWTATSTDVTLDVDEGEGAKAITATFDANTDTENAKTYTVKVSTTADVTTKEYTVTITQAKASSGNETVVSVDFIAQNNDLPQGSGNKLKDGTYTLGGQTFVMHAADGFYQGMNGANYYLLIGKKDSYIQLPAITGKALTKISFKTGEQASTSVIVDVTKDGTALNVNTSALNKGTEYSWDVAGEAGVAYRLQVMSAHNAQFQYLELKYE